MGGGSARHGGGAIASWSLVYLPDLDWTEAEATQTLGLLQQLKPGLVVSMAPCPFAEEIRHLECKPAVLDETQRAKLGVACGLPPIPLSLCKDTSTLHAIGHAEGGSPALVWLSSTEGKEKFNGPATNREELQSFARMQVRKQLGERHGEVVFLIDPSVPTPAEKTWSLPRDGVNYFYPEDGDDGYNVYLKDLRNDKDSLLYFACLSCAWPSTATWFTDRYVITSGSYNDSLDQTDETPFEPRFAEQTLHLFDLQSGQSFVTSSISRAADHSRPNAPTERIYFPEGSSYESGQQWRLLWRAIENGYHAKPEQAPYTMEKVAELANLPKDLGLHWQDLGIWPRPETWQLTPEKKDVDYAAPKPVAGGDPLLTAVLGGDVCITHYALWEYEACLPRAEARPVPSAYSVARSG